MRALVMSGGGAKGAFQVGVLKRWLGEQKIDYDVVCGVSVGALNAAALGMFRSSMETEASLWLEEFWRRRVSDDAIYRRWFPFGRLHALWQRSVFDSSPLAQLVEENIDLERIRCSGKVISVGAVSLDTGEHRFSGESDPNFKKWVLASSSFPVFFSPVEIDGQLWSDGGIKNVTPLGQAIRLGATEIDVIMCTNMDEMRTWASDTKRAMPDQVIRSIDLMVDQIIKNDIEICGLKNDLADSHARFKKVEVRIAMPDRPLTEDSLSFDPVEISKMIDAGYDAALKARYF